MKKLVEMSVIFSCFLAFPIVSRAELKVVATTTTLADIAAQIGGDLVQVSSVAPRGFDIHHIEPRPSDVLRVKRADLFIHTGLDLEAWREPLLQAAGNTNIAAGTQGNFASAPGLSILEIPTGTVTRAQGDIHALGNPHFQLDPKSIGIIAGRLAERLETLLPEHEKEIAEREVQFQSSLRKLDSDLSAAKASLKSKSILVYHDEWLYFAESAGVSIAGTIEPKPGIPPSASDVLRLRGLFQSKKIDALVLAVYSPKDTAESLSKETGAPTLVLCQNVGDLPECPHFQAMYAYDVQMLASARSANAR